MRRGLAPAYARQKNIKNKQPSDVKYNGTEYTPADIVNNGWGFVSDNTDNKPILYIGNASPLLSCKKVYCVVTDGYCSYSDKFEAGETYSILIYPGLTDYSFHLDWTLLGTINGRSVNSATDSLHNRPYIYTDITVPGGQSGEKVLSVYLTRDVTVPILGAAPATGLTAFDRRTQKAIDQRYSVESVAWSPNDSTFKANKSYTVTITLKAKEGYFFSPFEEITLNNNPVKIISLSNENGGTVVYSYTFTAKGDVDLNGVVNAVDAAYILKYAGGTITLTAKQLEAADNNIDALDAIYLLKKIR